ncbi:hypothetical protein [Undibacterium danionis]|uniref:Uncharacterized protein n=1 Tax=Undibacterium danionis TaxID=1812100 RepID=A0ABV6IFE0_9BURK
MKVSTCLQYCIKGMGKPLFNFANTKDGKTLINIQKKMNFNRDDQIKETLIAFNSYFMVEAAIRLKRLPKHPQSVIKFMGSDEFDHLHQEIVRTVEENYSMLMNCLNSKEKRKLNAMFD